MVVVFKQGLACKHNFDLCIGFDLTSYDSVPLVSLCVQMKDMLHPF